MLMLRPSIRDLASKKRSRLRARGVKEVVEESLRGVRNAVRSQGELVFLQRTADHPAEAVRKTDEPLGLVRATAADALDYERSIGTDSARTFTRRLSTETNCWLVRARGVVLHATWTTTGSAWMSEIGRYFVPPPRSAYIYESFTRSEARGLGLYPYALNGIGKVLAAEAIEDLFVGVESDNAPSLRAITKAGFEPAFTISFQRRFGRVTLDEIAGPVSEVARTYLRRE